MFDRIFFFLSLRFMCFFSRRVVFCSAFRLLLFPNRIKIDMIKVYRLFTEKFHSDKIAYVWMINLRSVVAYFGTKLHKIANNFIFVERTHKQPFIVRFHLCVEMSHPTVHYPLHFGSSSSLSSLASSFLVIFFGLVIKEKWQKQETWFFWTRFEHTLCKSIRNLWIYFAHRHHRYVHV